MKQKLSHYNKALGILLIGILLIGVGCQKDDAIHQEQQTTGVPVLKTLSYEEADETFKVLKRNLNIDRYLELPHQRHLRGKSTQDTLGLTLATDIIKQVALGDYTSYTMKIVQQTDATVFYNLTMESKNGQSSMFVTKYTPAQEWLNDKKKAYKGGVTSKRIPNELTQYTDPDAIFDEEQAGGSLGNPDLGAGVGGGGGSDYSSGSLIYPTDCNGIVTVTIEQITVLCQCASPGHLPGQCSNCNDPGYYEYVPYYRCQDYGDGDNNTTDPNDNGGTTGGVTLNPDPIDDTSISALVKPDECVERIDGDLNGDCELDAYEACLLNGNNQEVCDCVAESGNDVNTCIAATCISVEYFENFEQLSSENQAAIANYITTNGCSDANKEFVELAIETLQDGGEIDYDDEIILDASVINNQKLKCVYDKLKSLSNTYFKDAILSQFGSSNTNHIKITIGNIPEQIGINTAYTYTTYENGSDIDFKQGNIKYIRIDPNFIAGVSTMEIAITLLHEFIHAQLMDRCIKLGLIQEMGVLGETILISEPVLYSLPQIIFNILLIKYNAYEPGNSPDVNTQWNHDLFNALNYRTHLTQDLVSIHPLLNDLNSDFLTSVNNDPNIVGGQYTIPEIMNYKAWSGLEGTSDYENSITNIPTELAKLNYLESMFSTDYNHNCN